MTDDNATDHRLARLTRRIGCGLSLATAVVLFTLGVLGQARAIAHGWPPALLLALAIGLFGLAWYYALRLRLAGAARRRAACRR